MLSAAPINVPVRVDFAGGWLDVPRFARPYGYIVNMAISPCVTLTSWPYEKNSGLGGSAAWQILNGKDAVEYELKDNNSGWQDPAIIQETGLCVWKSGPKPKLVLKVDHTFLNGRLALHWTGKTHCTSEILNYKRDYDSIAEAGQVADVAVRKRDAWQLGIAIRLSRRCQMEEGMEPLPEFGQIAAKYCGSGHGGYAVYLFDSKELRDDACKAHKLMPIEPFLRGS